jgi:hypothetical protein
MPQKKNPIPKSTGTESYATKEESYPEEHRNGILCHNRNTGTESYATKNAVHLLTKSTMASRVSWRTQRPFRAPQALFLAGHAPP